jgi:hypothetical protein
MDKNKSPDSGTATTSTTGDPGERGGQGSEARETMIEGSKPEVAPNDIEDTKRRDPEYYGEQHDPS